MHPTTASFPLRLVCLSDDPTLADELAAALAPLGEAVALTVTDPDAPDLDGVSRAHGLLCGPLPGPVRAALGPDLRWVQFWSAGVDGKLSPELFGDVARPVRVCTGSGIHATSCSEHVLALMLAFARGLPPAFAAQQKRDWEARHEIAKAQFELEGKTVGIVGAGTIGQAIGARCQAFGMRTIGLRRDPSKPTHGMDIVLPHLQYHELILDSDFVVLALPLTPDTRLMFGEDEIEIIRKSAYVINIGRGGLIDETWLIRALQNRWIAGAGLDVFVDEPLPPDSPFWGLPNVLLTPHVGGGEGPRFWPRFARLAATQAERLLRGEPLVNVVDPDRGY